jgi:hypothetical protein
MQAIGWLVKDEQLRLVQQSCRQSQALFHARALAKELGRPGRRVD